jgi:amino acid transporter
MVAKVTTAFVLFTTFASLFAVLLGYSRVPYAAAVDGRFFSAFGRLHPTRNFPWVSVLFIGATSAVASLLDLSDLITALVVIQVLVQFMAQVVAVTMIRRYRPDIQRPFQMWFYPVTSVIAFAGWAFILAASGLKFILWGIALIAVGIGAYLWRARVQAEWPFGRTETKGAI